jgi:hypothetical protein
LEHWKRNRFPRLFGGQSTDAQNKVESKKAAARAKTATLESEYRRLSESQSETMYLVAGEDAAAARNMLSWGIAQYYEAQNTQYKLLQERVKQQKEAADKAKNAPRRRK